MKNNKFTLSLLLAGSLAFAQTTVTFNGCHSLFENQDFIFNKTGTDTFNKNIYITTPVNGDQPCSGVGTCEFKIEWNNTLNRWEFLADTGNGDFVNPYLIYYNSTGNSGAPNPPNNVVGTWVENTAVTNGDCGGNLSGTNSSLTGDVQTVTLGTENLNKGKIQIFPNPVIDYISISGVEKAQSIQIYSSNGQLVKTENFSGKINVKYLSAGVYILKVKSADLKTYEFKFIKN